MDRAFDRMIGTQLAKISDKRSHTEEDDVIYRKMLEKERDAASKRKRKTLSRDHEELARSTGLSGQVVALMAQEGDGGQKIAKKEKKSKKAKKKRRKRYENDSDSREDNRKRRKHKRKKKRRRRRKRT